MNRKFKWSRKNSRNGQKPTYEFEEISKNTLRVNRDNNGELFSREFSIGHRFRTYNDLDVEMIGLRSNTDDSSGYYIEVREIGGNGKKTNVSAQNQVDKLYFNKKRSDLFTSSSEVELSEKYIEGSVKQVLVNQYERNPQARKECIDHFGANCQICGFDFSKTYGSYGEGFIEVHHIKPLSEIKSGYEVNPYEDLIPVCSNCHSIIHRGEVPLPISEMKIIFTKDKMSATISK